MKKNMGSNGRVAMSNFSQNYVSNSLTQKELLVWVGVGGLKCFSYL